jgi:hypothetical protein
MQSQRYTVLTDYNPVQLLSVIQSVDHVCQDWEKFVYTTERQRAVEEISFPMM